MASQKGHEAVVKLLIASNPEVGVAAQVFSMKVP
jgi:hypothetical protein